MQKRSVGRPRIHPVGYQAIRNQAGFHNRARANKILKGLGLETKTFEIDSDEHGLGRVISDKTNVLTVVFNPRQFLGKKGKLGVFTPKEFREIVLQRLGQMGFSFQEKACFGFGRVGKELTYLVLEFD